MDKNLFNRLFSQMKYFCSGISVLLLIWLTCHLFIRSCGGPFPQRTRGPFAENRYDNLANMPEWENRVQPDPITGKTKVEDLIETGQLPQLKFGMPPEVHDATDSSSEQLQESLQNKSIRKATQ